MTENIAIEGVRSAVARANTRVLATLQANYTATYPNAPDGQIQGLNFQVGHLWEIIENQNEKGQVHITRPTKYPMIWLMEDITYQFGGQGEYDTATVTLIIAYGTKETYKSEQREALVFEPILYPTANALMEAIIDEPKFDMPHKPSYQFIPRKYWGTQQIQGNNGNMLQERLDAIEIRNLVLTLNQNCSFPVNRD